MIGIAKRYILNFWIWWYIIESKQVWKKIVGIASFTLGYLNVVPMAQNIFAPLYQDYSRTGRIIAFPIRLIWILIGSIIQLIITIPLLAIYLFYLVLPIMPLWAVADYLTNL